MKKSYSKIRAIKKTNLILEERYYKQKYALQEQVTANTPTQKFITVNVPTIQLQFDPGSSDSSKIISTIWTTVKNAIDTNPSAKSLFDQKKLTLQKLTIYAGSSNSYSGKETAWDTSNYAIENNLAGWGDYKSSPMGEDKIVDGYANNLILANNRGANISTNLKTTMSSNGIIVPDASKGQVLYESIIPGVIDTGGQLDDRRDKTVYPSPGQVAKIVMELSSSEQIQKMPITKEELISGLKNKTVLWGNNGGDYGALLDSWELKYLPGEGTGKETKVKPVVRWEFYYNTNNQLNKVVQIPDPGNIGVPTAVKVAFPNKEFPINPPGKMNLQSKVPIVYDLLNAAGVYERFFGTENGSK